MGESLRGGLSLCMSGFGFWSHDISGFENTASPDLYKRWAAFGLLSTHSRLHGSSSYRVPWLFDAEAVDVVRYFSKLKCSIMPYLYGVACNTEKTGVPAMRAMVLEFNKDRACDHLDTQYMLGDALLVAPVFRPEGTVDYYLPKGKWTNYISNQLVDGGSWQYEKHDFMSLPLMVRPNSIIAVGNNSDVPDYDFLEGTELHVFELVDDEAATATIYNVEGKAKANVLAIRRGEKVSINVSGLKNYSIIMRNVSTICDLVGATFGSNLLGSKLIPMVKADEINFKVI
jgi:alpha-D-xyloside xylohydrolase